MVGPVWVAIATTALGIGDPACPEVVDPDDYHLSDICNSLLADYPAYSATYQASLSPEPASQQVMLYLGEDGWVMRIAGYRWTPGGGEVVTRRFEVSISDDDAQQLVDRLSETTMQRLRELPYYGSDDVICTDGANTEIATALDGMKIAAAQHSCAGRTEINEIAAAFRELALRYDPAFEDLLSGFEA